MRKTGIFRCGIRDFYFAEIGNFILRILEKWFAFFGIHACGSWNFHLRNTVQKHITETLAKSELLIEKRKQELKALDDLIKARFVEMFGDPVLNEKRWNTKPLLSMGSCKNGMNFHYDDSGVEINCLGVGDFKDHSVISDTATLPTVSLNEMPSPEYLLQDDDIVFVRSNGNKKMVGRSVAVYPGTVPTTFSGFCIRYRRNDDTVITSYLLRVLKADSMREMMYGRGANIQNLNRNFLIN